MVKKRIQLGLGAGLPLTSLTNSVGYQLQVLDLDDPADAAVGPMALL